MTDEEHPQTPQTLGGALPPAELEGASDADLIRLVRSGDSAAYEHLFVRHREVAIRYARRISDSERAEDLCAEAFTKILDLLQRGKGPDIAFRAYLLTTVRTSHLNAIRSGSREDLVPDHEPIGRMVPHTDDPDARYDATAICRAFNKLPQRWQTALWLTSVEGLSHKEASEHLGVKVNAVASLTFRARAGLRQAYLSEHLLETTDPQCRRIIDLLPTYLRDGLTPRRKAAVEAHLSTCTPCTTATLELTEVNGRLGTLLAPIAVTGFAAGATVIVPAKATSLAAVGVTAISGAGTSAAAAAKSVVSSAVVQVKAGASAFTGIVGTKVVVAATVTAIGVGVGVEGARRGSPGEPAGPPLAQIPIVVDKVLPPAPVVSSAPTPPASEPITPRLAMNRVPPVTAPDVQPQTSPRATPSAAPPSPFTTPSPDPTPTAPTPTAPTPTAAPPPANGPATTMSVGEPSTQSHTQSGLRWEQVRVPVSAPAEDARLTVTTTRTLSTELASTAGTGWICGTPVTGWLDGNLFATSTITCMYAGNGDAGPLTFDYRVATGSVLTAVLVPPAGYLDNDLSDNQRQLRLR